MKPMRYWTVAAAAVTLLGASSAASDAKGFHLFGKRSHAVAAPAVRKAEPVPYHWTRGAAPKAHWDMVAEFKKVGLKPVDRAQRLRAGAHLVPRRDAADAAHDEGVVTSVAFSPTLGHWIGLGLLARGPQRHGERMWAADPVRNGMAEVEVCAPCFIDPFGERLRG